MGQHMTVDTTDTPKSGRGSNLKGLSKGRKPRRKAGERLTDEDAEKLAKAGYHNDGNGLYLSITAKGSKSWAFRFKWEGKLKEMGLGPYPSVSLEKARIERDKWRRVYQIENKNPIEMRREQEAAERATREAAQRQQADAETRRTTGTFGACATAYVDGQEEGWKNAKHRQQWRNTLKGYCGHIWDKDVAEITNSDVVTVLTPIWTTKHETATRLRGRIERVLAYAKVMKLRDGENPARWKENLDHIMPKVDKKLKRGHHKAKPHDKVRGLVAELRQIDAVGALALEFTVLAAKRTAEVQCMEWPEIDLDAKLWKIPPVRTKLNREHVEPLTDRQIEILHTMAALRAPAEVAAGTGYVFKGIKPGRPISHATMYRLLRRLGHDDATVHGFRSSFRDWAGDKTNFAREVAEFALSHKVGDDTEEAYRRGTALEKRRRLMEAWARYVEPSSSNVIQMGPARTRG